MSSGDRTYSRAIVRGVAETYDRCIRPHAGGDPIDVGLAREQHSAYCAVLESLGLELLRLEPDDRFPDCCFVEDTAVVVGDTAIICEMGAASRRGEEAAVAVALAGMNLRRLEPPATMDGGDAILDGDVLLLGLTGRTNEHAVRRVGGILAPAGVGVRGIPVTGVLHLKSACTPLSRGLMLISEPFAAAAGAAVGGDRVVVPRDEGYAANCLSVNGTVVVSAGHPRTKALVEERGFPTITLDMSEFRKGGGSLTCLSILL